MAAIAFFIFFNFNNVGLAQKPAYEKYSRIAMAVVQADFPSDPIRDYEYLGRKKINDKIVEDGFRFKVQENNKNFFVTVRVNHDIKNKKLVNLTVESQVPWIKLLKTKFVNLYLSGCRYGGPFNIWRARKGVFKWRKKC